MQIFHDRPSPSTLNWLVHGQLSNSFTRAIRLWVILDRVYGQTYWSELLPRPFRYKDIRDRLFASSHNPSDSLKAQELIETCSDTSCLCHKTVDQLIPIDQDWRSQLAAHTGMEQHEIEKLLEAYPFATVHRSIRADLKYLVESKWLRTTGKGQFCCFSEQYLPDPPIENNDPALGTISPQQGLELIRALEAISFVQPNLEIIIDQLSRKLIAETSLSEQDLRLTQRIFLHIDYVLSEQVQDRVDDYQRQIEELWHGENTGILRFNYWTRSNAIAKVNVYPVCIHYMRRAKYLSAYGWNEDGSFGWHNYRLDRITCDRLKVIAWDDPSVPFELISLYRENRLPTPQEVADEIDKAWGFRFYEPAELLIMRFPQWFARRYVEGTDRHNTFSSIKYDDLPNIIHKSVLEPSQKSLLLNLIKQKSPDDDYYQAWIRPNDINIIHRLRDWRPNGEVIAPLSVRQQMIDEVRMELENYSDRPPT